MLETCSPVSLEEAGLPDFHSCKRMDSPDNLRDVEVDDSRREGSPADTLTSVLWDMSYAHSTNP